MLRKIIFFFALALLVGKLSAQNVDPAIAAKVARNIYFLQQAGEQKMPLEAITPDLVYTDEVSALKNYYVFNISCGGFVIVSAFDAVAPVLGYAFRGSYQQHDQPEAFTRWMKDYSAQIYSARMLHFKASPQVKEEWQRLSQETVIDDKAGKSVSPMLLTTWDQGRYYNEYCPVDLDGEDDHVVVGCVPVAMAQIMNYYRWPLQGTGSYSYSDSTYGVLSADFGATHYRWNEMPLRLATYNSPVAELLYHLGVSVDLAYGPQGSGMYNHKAAYALRTYFGYSPATEYVFRDTAVNLNWKQLVIDHIDNGMPLYYAGWADTVNVSGHAFVCDGYQDTTFFHFNWGWDGYYDGYFMLDDLTPGANDFTLDHELIINMAPNGAYPYFCTGTDTLTTFHGNVSDGSGPLANYTDDADCSWLIAPEDSVSYIKLTFHQFSVTGSGDTLFVYDGDNTSAPLLGSYSGALLPPVLTSTGPYLLLHFVSDSATNSAGWMADYQSTLPVYCSGIQTLTALSGNLGDGSGPRDYHNNSLCRWKVEPTGATTVSLHFNAFDLGTGDYLDVYDGSNSALLAHLTGDSIPGDITSPSGKLLIVFMADSKITAGGWEAEYGNFAAIGEPEVLTGISIFPNPANDHFTVSGYSIRSGNATLQLWNSGLSEVFSQSLNLSTGPFSIRLSTGHLAPGLYLLRILSDNEQSFHKIVISE